MQSGNTTNCSHKMFILTTSLHWPQSTLITFLTPLPLTPFQNGPQRILSCFDEVCIWPPPHIDHKVLNHIFESLTSNHHPTWNTNFSTKFSRSLFWTHSHMDHKALNIVFHDAYYLPPAHMEHKILICLGKKFISTNSPHRQQSYSSKSLLLTTSPHGPKSNES